MSRVPLADQVLSKPFRDELDRILNCHNNKVHCSTKEIPRDCSKKTRHERRNNLRLIFAELHSLGYRLQDPTALKPKHLHAIGMYWMQRGLAPKTVHGLFSNLREFCRWIGKAGMVQDVGTYCGGRAHLVRHVAAVEDRSWEGNGLSVEEVLAKARELDLRLAVMLRLQRHFGLRVKESIEFRPWRATAYGDTHLYVTDGTKGGRHRMIPVRDDIQREVLRAAKEIVGSRLSAQLRWPEMTWKQAQSHYYYLMQGLGITRERLGVSSHGLRHGFLQDEYQYYAGVAAPVKHMGVLPRSQMEHKQALLAVSLEAGHFRQAATGMYCGSIGHQRRPTKDASPNSNNLSDGSTQKEVK